MKFNYILFFYIIYIALQLKWVHIANKLGKSSLSINKENLNEVKFVFNKNNPIDEIQLIKNNFNLENSDYKNSNNKLKHVKIDFIIPQNDSIKENNSESDFLQINKEEIEKVHNYTSNQNNSNKKNITNNKRSKYSTHHYHSKNSTTLKTHSNETAENLSYLKNNEASGFKHLMKKVKKDSDFENPEESNSANQDEDSVNSDTGKTRTGANIGFKGYCLIKYDNYLVNLHLISLKDNNFFIKSFDGVVDFNICHNIKSYDESKKGLVVNRIKNILYAGNSHTEKFFMINNFEKNQEKAAPLLKAHSKTNKNHNLHTNNNNHNNQNQNLNQTKNNPENTKSIKSAEKTNNENEDEKPLFKNIQIYLPQGEFCATDASGKASRYTIMYELSCDPIAEKAYIANEYEFNSNACFNKIKIKTRYVCPKFMKKFLSWYQRFFISKYVLALLLLANGVFLMFFGRLKLNLSMCCSITLLCYMIMGAENWIDGKAISKDIFLILLVPLICLLYYNIPSVLYWIMSMLIAFTLGDMFNCLTVKFIVMNNVLNFDEYKLLVLTILICLFILLTCKYNYQNAYWQTTFVGAYSFVRGISINYGKFPDKVFINILIKHKEFVQYDRAFEGIATYYLIAIVILWIGSFFLQKFYVEVFFEELKTHINNDLKANQARNNQNNKRKMSKKEIEKLQIFDDTKDVIEEESEKLEEKGIEVNKKNKENVVERKSILNVKRNKKFDSNKNEDKENVFNKENNSLIENDNNNNNKNINNQVASNADKLSLKLI